MKTTKNNITPAIAPSAFIAPNAMIIGDVIIGKNVCIMYGAQIIAENSAITIGDNCIILENAVLRGANGFSLTIGNNCLIGPNTHLVGCTIKDNVFIATGSSIFHGALLEKNSEIRINGVVHVKSVLEEGQIVPIGWIAVGNPAQLFTPNQHDEIWEIQQKLKFNKTVYGVDESKNNMPIVCKEMRHRFKEHFSQHSMTSNE